MLCWACAALAANSRHMNMHVDVCCALFRSLCVGLVRLNHVVSQLLLQELVLTPHLLVPLLHRHCHRLCLWGPSQASEGQVHRHNNVQCAKQQQVSTWSVIKWDSGTPWNTQFANHPKNAAAYVCLYPSWKVAVLRPLRLVSVQQVR